MLNQRFPPCLQHSSIHRTNHTTTSRNEFASRIPSFPGIPLQLPPPQGNIPLCRAQVAAPARRGIPIMRILSHSRVQAMERDDRKECLMVMTLPVALSAGGSHLVCIHLRITSWKLQRRCTCLRARHMSAARSNAGWRLKSMKRWSGM